jgi:hypothetical protein
MCLSRYDRAIASAIAGPVLEGLPEYLAWSNTSPFNGRPAIVKTLVAYDPRAAASVLRALPASTRKAREPSFEPKGVSVESSIRLEIVEALAAPPGPGRAKAAGRAETLAPIYRLDR